MSTTDTLAWPFKTLEGKKQFMAAYDTSLSLWPVPFESLHVPTSFGSTHVIVSGPVDAPPLVLLHGFGFSATMWYANIEALSQHFRTYAIDFLGDMNKSVSTAPMKTRADLVTWLTEVVDALNIEHASIIGHSYGGWNTVNFALSMPHRVTSLVLLAPAATLVPMKKQFFIRQTFALLRRSRASITRFANWFVPKGYRVPPHLLEQFVQGFLHFRFSSVVLPSVYTDAELASLDVPTLLLIGEQEVIYLTEAAMKRAKEQIRNLQAEVVLGASHTLSVERTEVVNTRMLEFLHEVHGGVLAGNAAI